MLATQVAHTSWSHKLIAQGMADCTSTYIVKVCEEMSINEQMKDNVCLLPLYCEYPNTQHPLFSQNVQIPICTTPLTPPTTALAAAAAAITARRTPRPPSHAFSPHLSQHRSEEICILSHLPSSQISQYIGIICINTATCRAIVRELLVWPISDHDRQIGGVLLGH